ncbi:MAG: DUF2017 domain-containing protein [Actinomycetota bacterium]|nr:DUF2017 domain-containing protein [Actinomycetota bacterium]
MPAPFRRTPSGIAVRLRPAEAQLIAMLAERLLELLDDRAPNATAAGADPLTALVGLPDPAGAPPERPPDPVLARLLPDGYADESAAAELRRLTESDLVAGKRAAAAALRDGLRATPPPVLDEEQAQLWLGALNDLRLALGTRLEVSEDLGRQMKRLEYNDPRLAGLQTYEWLTDVQALLIELIESGRPAGRR